MTIHFAHAPNAAPGKIADAEIRFDDGPLAGLKLVGFAIWERSRSTSFNVTFPSRMYQVNGERRSFALLRPAGDTDLDASDRLRLQILAAFAEWHEANREGV